MSSKQEATIRFVSRDVDLPVNGIDGDYRQHSFAILTDSVGRSTIIRAGFEGEGIIGMVKGDLKASVAAYVPGGIDWVSDPSKFRTDQVIFRGTGAELHEKAKQMMVVGDKINVLRLDFKPVDKWDIPAQNCNVALIKMLMAAGLWDRVELPAYHNGQKISFPGNKFKEFGPTTFDKKIQELLDMDIKFDPKDPNLFTTVQREKETIEKLKWPDLTGWYESYTVKDGDSLWQIARDNRLSIGEVLDASGNEELKKRYQEYEDGRAHVTIHPGEKVVVRNDKRDSSKQEATQGFFSRAAGVVKEGGERHVEAEIYYEELKEEQRRKNLEALKKFGQGALEKAREIPQQASDISRGVGDATVDALRQQAQTSAEVNQLMADHWAQKVDVADKAIGEAWHSTIDATQRGAERVKDMSRVMGEYADKATGAVKRAMPDLVAGAKEVGFGALDASMPGAGTLLKIVTGDYAEIHKGKDMTSTYQDGLAKHGARHEVYMAADVLNDDGLFNHGPSSKVTGNFRPGEGKLSSVNAERKIGNLASAKPESFMDRVESSIKEMVVDPVHKFLQGMNNENRWSHTYQNIDPIVINIDGAGLRIILLDESQVIFDVDNDGYAEKTEWIKKGNVFLVVDKNKNGRADDITELFSEYYFDEPRFNTKAVVDTSKRRSLRDIYKENPFDALDVFDFNRDRVIDVQDPIFSELRLWHDKNENGFCEGDELQTLSAYDITSISLQYIIAQEVGLPQVRYTSYSLTSDGQSFSVYSVVFDSQSEGDMFQEISVGKVTRSETGFASLMLSTSFMMPVFISDFGVQNLYGSGDDDIVVGNNQSNWLFGGRGDDAIFGEGGNDLIVFDAEDNPNFIDGGDGFDIAFASDNAGEGIIFIMNPSGIEQVYGTNFPDFIAVGNVNGTTVGGFIDGNGGDDLLIGDDASDSISGGDGEDHIKGMRDNDLLRGDRGNDIVEGNEGNDVIEGGDGDDILFGGEGDDTLKGDRGNDKIHGGPGNDCVEYSGLVDEYRITKVGNNRYRICDLRPNREGCDELIEVEMLTFSSSGGLYTVTLNDLFHGYEDYVPIAAGGDTVIDSKDLLKNDVNFSSQEIYICDAKDSQNGEVSLVKSGNKATQIKFKPTGKGVKQFGYTLCTDNYRDVIKITRTGEETDHYTRVYLTENKHPKDEFFYKQWYLSYMNVVRAWELYTGAGVKVLINEANADYTHKDLRDNLLYYDDTMTESFNVHATTVAGVVGASINDFGLVGIAYNAILGSDGAVLDSQKKYDVINRSWTWSGDIRFAKSQLQTLEKPLVKEGRDGLGTVIVQAAGNQREEGDCTNDYQQTSSPYSIVVGAIHKDVSLAYGETQVDAFSNRGASILVAAPGSYILTSSTLTENDDGNVFTWDFDTVKGTSFSAPIISAIVALMFEANSWLGYRDVQKILASTARAVHDPKTEWRNSADLSWNFKGMHYSLDYGFGCADAYSATKFAEFWPYVSAYSNLKRVKVESELVGLKVIDSQDEITGEIEVKDELIIQDVKLGYQISHKAFEDVVIELVSPSGTKSTLKEQSKKKVTSSSIKFRALSKHFLGERSVGVWRYTFKNYHNMQVGFLREVKLTLYGDVMTNRLFMFTPEVVAVEPRTIQLADVGASGIMFMPAIEDDLSISLMVNQQFHVGKFTFVSKQTLVNNFVSGVGNDVVWGNRFNNVIYGNDGDDKLYGQLGSDVLVGGRGNDTLNGGTEADVFVIHYETSSRDKIEDLSGEDYVMFVGFKGRELEAVTEYTNNKSVPNSHIFFLEYFNYHLFSRMGTDESYHRVNTNINQFILGGKGRDVLHGSEGHDLLLGDDGDDVLIGWGGNDVINGGDGDDHIKAMEGNDVICGGCGVNHLWGGDGKDVYMIEKWGRDIIYDFSVEEDRLDLSSFDLSLEQVWERVKVSRCEKEYDWGEPSRCTYIEDNDWHVVLIGINLSREEGVVFSL